MDPTLKVALTDIVGGENFTDDIIDLVSYSYDASDHRYRPEAAVWPKDALEISRILKLANERRLPVTPRGAGTGLAGGAVPARSGLVLDLCRMNKILDIRVEDRIAVVQPGVVYMDLQKALSKNGFFFPPDPASGRVCTLGGNVATNAGGIRGAKYGVTRDYVLGLEVVLADGRMLRTGSKCMKSVSGYDLTHLMVGSEGTLGVVTEIILKISPKPLVLHTALASFASLEDAGRAVSRIASSGLVPSVLEVIDENAIEVIRKQAPVDLRDATALILVETDGYTEAEAAFQMERVLQVCRKGRATDIRRASSEEEAERLWRVRKSIGSAAAKLRPANVSEDVTVPMSRLTPLLSGISGIVRRYGLPFVIFGHAGDGNLHPKIMYDPRDEKQVKGVGKAVEEIFQLTCRLGGTLTGEHGIGLAKAPFMPLEHDETALDVMRKLKMLLDPKNILNPGKMNLEY